VTSDREGRDGDGRARWARAVALGVGTGVVVGWLAVYGVRPWVGVAAGGAVGAAVGVLAGLTEAWAARRRER
jgi:hypothetical protein